MVRLTKPVPCHATYPFQRALKCRAAFILLGSMERRSRCCWSENSIRCEAPCICVWKAVFPPYVGSVVHLLTSHGLSVRALHLCNFCTWKKRRPVVGIQCFARVLWCVIAVKRLAFPAWVLWLATCGSVPRTVDSQKIIVCTHTLKHFPLLLLSFIPFLP